MKRIVRKAVLAVAIYWIVMFAATHLPVAVKGPVPHFDKLVHFAAYAGLAAGLFAVFQASLRRSPQGPILAVAIPAAYAIADEIMQMWVPGRSADLYDWFADVCGAICGAALAWACFAIVRRRSTRRPSEAVVDSRT